MWYVIKILYAIFAFALALVLFQTANGLYEYSLAVITFLSVFLILSVRRIIKGEVKQIVICDCNSEVNDIKIELTNADCKCIENMFRKHYVALSVPGDYKYSDFYLYVKSERHEEKLFYCVNSDGSKAIKPKNKLLEVELKDEEMAVFCEILKNNGLIND